VLRWNAGQWALGSILVIGSKAKHFVEREAVDGTTAARRSNVASRHEPLMVISEDRFLVYAQDLRCLLRGDLARKVQPIHQFVG